jgi:hypothetical protein
MPNPKPGARERIAAARQALAARIGPTNDGSQDVARLDAGFPILLVPVRLETRFGTDQDGPVLRVRIYPDDFAADLHEAALTDDERALGKQYWTDGWQPNDELNAWRALIRMLPEPRAAWVVASMTPTNMSSRPGAPPVFPNPAARPDVWTRAAYAKVLPDRWVVICTRGANSTTAVSKPVIEPLALTLSPSADASNPADVVDLSDGMTVDREMLWTIDYDEAEKAGMAVTISLKDDDARLGFERVIAVGVKSSLASKDPKAPQTGGAPAEGASRLAELLDAHHYGRGLAIVAQGTPTNNTAAGGSGYPPPDPDGTVSFAVERGAPLAADGTDGAALAAALGLPASTFDHIEGADRHEGDHARAMNGLLWPATGGYYLEQMLPPVSNAETTRQLESYFVQHVRGNGSLPLFRVDATPYGVLPVTSLDRWAARAGTTEPQALVAKVVGALRPKWTQQAGNVPRVGRTQDPDQDLLDILAGDASAREVWIRDVLGPVFVRNLADFLGADIGSWVQQANAVRAQLVALFNQLGEQPRIMEMLFSADAFRFRHPLVAPTPLSETDPLDFNYLRWLRSASLADVRDQNFPAGAAAPNALLYQLARVALLRQYANAAIDLSVRARAATVAERLDRELVGVAAGDATPTVWQRLDAKLPAVTRTESVGDYLQRSANAQRVVASGRAVAVTSIDGRSPGAVVEATPIASALENLEMLQGVPEAELDRLFGNTLDCAAHRLDAWATSLAAARLDELRASKPSGIHLGAYGWVENLVPAPQRNVVVKRPDGTQVTMQADSGGFVHAPSMDHASAAAILRNAYLTRRGDEQQRYALDLSSSRVRAARWLLACIREGQPLAALLGYQFERGLHEGHAPLELDQFIEPFRLRYPLPEVKGATSTDPAQSISPRNVVNGLDLRNAKRDDTLFSSLPVAPNNDERAAILAELAALDETLDGVADVLTSEAVYNLVRGTTEGAAASLDSLAQGVRPPDPGVSHTPRAGTLVAHRVGAVFGATPVASPGWDAIAATPRAAAEPCLDAWVGTLLGSPAQVRCDVTVADPSTANPDRQRVVTITFDKLGLHPLDLLAIVANADANAASVTANPHRDDASAKPSELDLRILNVALADPALADATLRGSASIAYVRDPAWAAATRSVGELLEMARAVNDVLQSARALQPSDLVTPEGAAGTTFVVDDADAAARVSTAKTALDQTKTALDAAVAAIPPVPPGGPEPDLSPLRDVLRRAAAFGIASAYPGAPNKTLDRAKALLDARIAALPNPPKPADMPPIRDALRRAATLGIAVGPKDVMVDATNRDVATTIGAANNASTSLGAAITTARQRDREALVALAKSVSAEMGRRSSGVAPANAAPDNAKAVFGGNFMLLTRFVPHEQVELQKALAYGPTLAPDDEAKRRWLAQAARVRVSLGRWRMVELYSSCIDAAPPPLSIAQLPHADPASWVALPFADESKRPPSGRVALAVVRSAKPAATDPWVGLLFDEWTEMIPAVQESTGVAFHYDDPGAEAPQTMLLAVPPKPDAKSWDLPTLLAILNETFDLVKVRGVHNDLLGDLGQLLPAVFAPVNAERETVSVDLSQARALSAAVRV